MSGWFTDDEDEYVPNVVIEWSKRDKCYVAGIEGTKLCLRLEGNTPQEAYANGKERILFYLSNISEIDNFVESCPSYGKRKKSK